MMQVMTYNMVNNLVNVYYSTVFIKSNVFIKMLSGHSVIPSV